MINNSLNRVSDDNFVGNKGDKKDFSALKTIILGALFAGASFIFGFQMNLLSYIPKGSEVVNFIPFAISISVFLVLLNLCVIIVSNKNMLLWILSASSILFFVGFLSFKSDVLIAGGVMLVGLIWIGNSVRNYLDESIKIKFFPISNMILRKAILILAVISAVLFYNTFYSTSLGKDNPIFPKSIFETISVKFSNLASPVIGEVDLSKSLRGIAEESIRKIEKENGIVLPTIQEKELVDKAVLEYQEKLNKIFGQTINPNDAIYSALYDTILYKFNNMEKNMRTMLLVVMAFLLFLTIQAVSPILRFVIMIISFLIYEILLLTKFFKYTYTQESKERISLL